jgi:hypothetical protein
VWALQAQQEATRRRAAAWEQLAAATPNRQVPVATTAAH